MRRIKGVFGLAVLTGLACTPERDRDLGDGEILAMGDSIVAWNFNEFSSISDFIARDTGLEVDNAAVGGATLGGNEDSIPAQYISRSWRWVVLDGGANDLGNCGCGDCLPVVDDLISEDLSEGLMPTLIDRIAADGAKIVLLGLYTVPPGDDFDGCEEEMELLDERYAALADARDDLWFYDMGDVIGPEDLSDFDADRVHPSPAGSEKIGVAVAALIDSVENP